jgi:hypothetical protein
MVATRKTRLYLILVIIGSLLIMTVAAIIHHSISISLQAEKTLIANYVILDVLEVYLTDNPGRWPESWEDLKHTSIPKERQRLYAWPQDIDEFKKRVDVEFGLTLQQVADMLTPEQVERWEFTNFTAVRPIGPNYGPCESRLAHFMGVVWRQNSGAERKQVPAKRARKASSSLQE